MRILVVEDQKPKHTTLTVRLKRAGFLIQAVPALDDLRPDIMVIDLDVPERDGCETIRQFKALPGLDTIPCIALTSRAAPAGSEHACAAWMRKPIDFGELVLLIETLTQDPPPPYAELAVGR